MCEQLADTRYIWEVVWGNCMGLYHHWLCCQEPCRHVAMVCEWWLRGWNGTQWCGVIEQSIRQTLHTHLILGSEQDPFDPTSPIPLRHNYPHLHTQIAYPITFDCCWSPITFITSTQQHLSPPPSLWSHTSQDARDPWMPDALWACTSCAGGIFGFWQGTRWMGSPLFMGRCHKIRIRCRWQYTGIRAVRNPCKGVCGQNQCHVWTCMWPEVPLDQDLASGSRIRRCSDLTGVPHTSEDIIYPPVSDSQIWDTGPPGDCSQNSLISWRMLTTQCYRYPGWPTPHPSSMTLYNGHNLSEFIRQIEQRLLWPYTLTRLSLL